MKRSYRGLSLEIRELKEKYVIIVEDKTDGKLKSYKQRFEAPKDDTEAKRELLDNAKEWLWNMGNYNGEANVMMDRCYYDWIKALKLSVPYDEYFSAILGMAM